MSKISENKPNRLYSESESQAFYLMGRLQRLVKPKEGNIHQQLEYGKANFTELQSLALECVFDKLEVAIEKMSTHIGDLEISEGTAKYAKSI